MVDESSHRFLIQREQRYGFIDRTGAVVIAPDLDDADPFHEGLAYFARGGRRGLMDQEGAEVVGFGADIDEVKTCSEGLIPFRRGELWGYLDRAGTVVIEPQYDIAWEFAGGIAVTETRDRRVFIDPANNHLFERSATFLGGDFRARLTPISHRGKMGYIDRTGQRVIPFRYLVAQEFVDGLAAVKFIKPTAELGNLPGVAYSDQHSWVAGFIDERGRPQWDQFFYDSDTFAEGLAAVQVTRDESIETSTLGLHGYVDRTGAMVIEPQFSVAGQFAAGLASVSVRKKSNRHPSRTYGFIDRTGAVVIEPRFDLAEPFHGGLAWVVFERRNAYVDSSDRLVYVADQPSHHW